MGLFSKNSDASPKFIKVSNDSGVDPDEFKMVIDKNLILHQGRIVGVSEDPLIVRLENKEKAKDFLDRTVNISVQEYTPTEAELAFMGKEYVRDAFLDLALWMFNTEKGNEKLTDMMELVQDYYYLDFIEFTYNDNALLNFTDDVLHIKRTVVEQADIPSEAIHLVKTQLGYATEF